MLLQVNPKEEWNGEYSLLTKIWGKWFGEMGISNYRFIKDDNINEVKESLEKFMDIKLAGKTVAEHWTRIDTIDSTLLPKPAAAKEKNNIPTVAATSLQTEKKKTAVSALAHTATAPDESGAGELNAKKKDNPAGKKAVTAGNDDILKDGTPASGFNTGIKKDQKKEPFITGRRNR